MLLFALTALAYDHDVGCWISLQYMMCYICDCDSPVAECCVSSCHPSIFILIPLWPSANMSRPYLWPQIYHAPHVWNRPIASRCYFLYKTGRSCDSYKCFVRVCFESIMFPCIFSYCKYSLILCALDLVWAGSAVLYLYEVFFSVLNDDPIIL